MRNPNTDPNGHFHVQFANEFNEPIRVVIVNSFTSLPLDRINYRQDEIAFDRIEPGAVTLLDDAYRIPIWATGYGFGGPQTYKLVVWGLESGKMFINDVDDLSFYTGSDFGGVVTLRLHPGVGNYAYDEPVLDITFSSGRTIVKPATLHRTDGEMIIRPNRRALVHAHNSHGHQVSNINLIFKCGWAWKQTLHAIRIEEGQTSYEPGTLWFRYLEQPCFLRINFDAITVPVENEEGWVQIHLGEKDSETNINVDLNATTTITLADGSLYQMRMKPRGNEPKGKLNNQ